MYILCNIEGRAFKISKYLNTKRSLISFIVQIFAIFAVNNGYKQPIWI